MMLRDSARVRIAVWEIPLQVSLHIMHRAEPLAQIDHAQRILAPVNRRGHREIVGPADLVQVNKRMSSLNDLQAGRAVERGFETDPREDARVVKSSQSGDSISRKCSTSLPLAGELVIECGERRGKGVSRWSEERQISKPARPALGQGANAETILLQREDRFGRQCGISRVIGVGGEGQHDLFRDAVREVLLRVFGQRIEEVWAFVGPRVKLAAFNLQDARDIAVRAFMTAASVGIRGEWGVFSGLSGWGVNVRTAFD